MKTLAWCSIVIILVAFGCKKNHNQVDPALQNAYSFPKGTYWIYKDSLSGDIDSFFVADNSLASDPTNDGFNDQISMAISEISEYQPKIETSQWQLDLNLSSIYLSWLQRNATPISRADYYYSPLAFYPFVIGSSLGGGHSIATIIQNFKTYTVGSNTFNKVTLINDTLSGTPNSSDPYRNDWFYLSDGIGIIKMHLYHPHDTLDRIWELQRWHIGK